LVCSNCGTANEPGRKFCRECGAALARSCPSCGAANDAGAKFCGNCGSPLTETLERPSEQPAQPPFPVAERRLVSVLFADLVGFTAASEGRDPEDTRELLGRYFDAARQLIGRYGGTVEKFIGDAVMAVWGTPQATEYDAEVAVRAALDLVAAVADLGAQSGIADLEARAGVLTGEAAVTLGADRQGMVAGDMVNTASRIQTAAAPGEVLVGDATKHATEASVVYEDAGLHDLKGKAEPAHLWRALRVVAGRGGALKSHGLEAPFVGRDRELRTTKDLFHVTADDGKAHLFAVTGVAGIGKSRLAWEFFKYIDGLRDTSYWHRGRCLPYGDGVAFWALAEMVRTRAGIAEEEAPSSAAEKLAATVQEHIDDPEERDWVTGRLAHLLGLEERTAGEPEDLFAAWRRFFERLAERYPAVLVFEDIQWADSALLDFVEYLLEWSRNHRLFVVTLARPELVERRPGWGAGRRNSTSLFLEPLSDGAMDEMIGGLVPGLPEDVRVRIRERAEGVPLYAVETVRMLLDRGLLKQEGSRYVVSGPVEELAVPESLQGLIAARLDGLPAAERSLLQDASVLGKTFSIAGLAAVTARPEAELEPLLTSLVRKEVLGLQSDPRSPERGQFGFLQALVRKVAYDTLAKRDRKAKHLAVARYLESSWGPEDEEIVQVVASHYLDAYRAAPADPDAAEIKSKARETLVRAARRAESLAAHEEAWRYFDRALELTEDELQRAGLLEQSGEQARSAGKVQEAVERYSEAIELFERNGLSHPAARVSGRLGLVEWWDLGKLDQAVERMEASFQMLSKEEPDADVAELASDLGRLYYFRGRPDLALERAEFALPIAEALALPNVLSHSLNTKSLVMLDGRRPQEADALLTRALEVSLEHDRHAAALRAYANLSVLHGGTLDRYDRAREILRDGIALAERVGERSMVWFLQMHLSTVRYFTGRWDEALELITGLPEVEEALHARASILVGTLTRVLIETERGRSDEVADLLRVIAGLDATGDVQETALTMTVNVAAARVRGDDEAALRSALEGLRGGTNLPLTHPNVRFMWLEALESAFRLEDRGAVEELVGMADRLPPGIRPPHVRASTARAKARLAWWREEGEAGERESRTAEGMFRELGAPFWLAATLLERAEWLSSAGRGAEASEPMAEAHEIFEGLAATPWMLRAAGAAQTVEAEAVQ
jgi:class 3 adenylate cyclase/tetratricopeptide (TPR) repeat protein